LRKSSISISPPEEMQRLSDKNAGGQNAEVVINDNSEIKK